MNRFTPVIILSCLFIIAGTVGIIYHVNDLRLLSSSSDAVLVLVIRLLAIVGGVFALRRKNWARWLLLAWISYHVFLSLYHPLTELLLHTALLAAVVYIYFLAKSSSYFVK